MADSGWHVYSNMEHLLNQATAASDGCPYACPIYEARGGAVEYWRGMLPQTDDLLARAMNISIGVSDPGLGSAFGVKVSDGLAEVETSAEKFQSAYLKNIAS